MDPFQSQINPKHIVTLSTYVTIWPYYDTGIYRGAYEWKYKLTQLPYLYLRTIYNNRFASGRTYYLDQMYKKTTMTLFWKEYNP